MSIIKVRNAVKTFGPITAVAGLDLDVAEGECFGLLGPNGAGKTSLVRMIIAASPLTEGNIWVDGKDIGRECRQIKADLGVVPQEDNLDPDLSVLQNLITFARYFDVSQAEARERALANLRFFELHERQKAKIDELSGGMKRRLLIARALINRPKLLILDEPTVGLDPQTKHLVWQRLVSLREQGMTLLLCTQNMEEAGRLCDRVAIMNEGKIITLGSPQELVSRHGGSQVLEARPSPQSRSLVLTKLKENGFEWQEIEDTLYIFQGDGQLLEDELRQMLGIQDQHVPTLEDVFLRLTGRSIQE
ncbi:MAG: ABC transporter ATP-binding protein [Dehalococcoidia bacterium]|nr:ABC transporter ATP-binding protein [Dehalococcoidia bacterium]